VRQDERQKEQNQFLNFLSYFKSFSKSKKIFWDSISFLKLKFKFKIRFRQEVNIPKVKFEFQFEFQILFRGQLDHPGPAKTFIFGQKIINLVQ
jgi:hypothetical protein